MMKLNTLALLATFAVAPAMAADNDGHGMANHTMAGHEMAGHEMASMEGAAGVVEAQAEGIVNAVNNEGSTINISHAPIAAFRWPAMTMDLAVADPALLDQVKAGDKVTFTLHKYDDVTYAITQIQKQ